MGCFPRGYFVFLGYRFLFELLKQVMSPCPKMYRSLRYEYLHDRFCRVRVISVGYWMLDVLTPLSDCIHESVEKMEWRISGGSYMYWMDFHNGILCCGFLCARFVSVSLFPAATPHRVSFPAITPRTTTPHLYPTGYHALTTTARLSRLCIYIPAITP